MEKSNRKHIVFFTPSLQRTGSEMVLYNLLPFIRDKFDITVVAKYKGELYDALPAYIKKDYLYASYPSTILIKTKNRIKDRFSITKKLNKYKNATWYVNTIVLPDIIAFAEEHKIPVIVHLHELEQMYKLLLPQQVQRLVSYPFLMIANSQASAAVVKNKGAQVPLQICYPAIDTRKIVMDEETKAAYRRKLSIQDDEFVWVMAGTVDANKNPFLFVDVAEKLSRISGRKLKFVWLGGAPDGGTAYYENVVSYVERKGLKEHIAFTGALKDEFRNYFMIADGFVLTSEYESFSLVTLEALLLGLPVVANNCGGVEEILENKFGRLLKHKNDAEEMAVQMKTVMERERSREEVAAQIAHAKKFDLETWGHKWSELLTNTVIKR